MKGLDGYIVGSMAKKQTYTRLKEVLKEKGMNQAQLADALDLRYVTINRIANGHREPTMELLFRIAKILKVSPKDLLRE